MAEWQPIETLPRHEDQFVLVHQDGAVRLLYWDSRVGLWTYPDLPFAPYEGIVRDPTEWMPIPDMPPSRTGAEP